MTVYLKLLHGRDEPGEVMDSWGFNGPLLGPFAAVTLMYGLHLQCFDAEGEEVLALIYRDKLLAYDGKFYGNFEIGSHFYVDPAWLTAGGRT